MSQTTPLTKSTALKSRIENLHRITMDVAQTLIDEHLSEEEAAEFQDNQDAVQAHIDAMADHIYADIRRHSGSYAGVEYLFSTYNEEWFQTAPYSENIILDIAAQLFETTRPWRINNLWKSVFSEAEPATQVPDPIPAAVANAIATSVTN